MKVTSLFLAIALTCPAAQVILSGSGSKEGIQFRYETRVEPERAQNVSGFGGGLIAGDRFHRYLTDRSAKKYFGYDLIIEPAVDKAFRGRFRVTFAQLRYDMSKTLGPDWQQIPLPTLPPPQLVRSRDTIVVDLLEARGTGQKIVDYLYIQHDSREVRLPSGAPRNYTVEDVPLWIGEGMKLTRNGKQLLEWDRGGIGGQAVYLYVPHYGRVAFTLLPLAELGFQRSGEVRGSSLSITLGSDTFVIDTAVPIAPGGGVFNLYVRHDASWRPRNAAEVDQVHFGASEARSMGR